MSGEHQKSVENWILTAIEEAAYKRAVALIEENLVAAKFKMFGLNAAQISWLKAYWESRNGGKSATEIDVTSPVNVPQS